MLNDHKNIYIFISGLQTTAQESISKVPSKLTSDEKSSEKVSHDGDEAPGRARSGGTCSARIRGKDVGKHLS